MTRHHRYRLRGPLLLALIALVAAAGPAAAAETIQGSGAGTGYSDINVKGQPTAPLCISGTSGSQYVVNLAEAVVGASETMPNATGQYTGPATVTITLKEAFFFSPAGIFSDDLCTMPTLVDANIVVASVGTGLSCTTDGGKFSRVNTAISFEEAARDGATLDGTCTVGGVTVSPVTHTFAGNEYPCLDPAQGPVGPPPPPGTTTCPVVGGVDPGQSHVQGVWTVTGADATN